MNKILVAMLALVAAMGMAHAGDATDAANAKNQILRKMQQATAQPGVSLRAVSDGPLQPFRVTAAVGTCDGSVPNTIIHDDGEAENGYGWNPVAGYGRFASKFTPQMYPATISVVCAAFITNAGATDLDFTIAVYDDDGTDGAPGTLLGSKSFTAHPDAIAGVPATPTFESFYVADMALNITDGSVYISVEWDAATAPDGVFIAADESTTTSLVPGYLKAGTDPWTLISANTTYAAYRSLFVRAIMPEPGPLAPSVSKSFAPSQVPVGEPSTLTITLDNSTRTTAAVLGTDFMDNFPAGLVVAATPNAATTCDNATLTAAAGAGSITLASGSEIPAEGSCTITVDVTSGANGAYENVIPAGALVTNHGSNVAATSATLQVGYVFPEPYCSIDFTFTVEPISRVKFADIDNSSDATVDATPALQNFTSIIGHVDPGTTVQVVVEGNTNGPYTTPIKVYIDWDQNFVFDADEGYLIGALDSSTGTDGQQVIGSITVPIDAMQGETRMRVTKKFNSPASACGSNSFGQAEDYTLEVAALDPSPRVAKAFAPSIVPANTPSTLTITLINDQNTGDATLTTDFTDTFPSGLVVAATANASTTCIDGTVTAAAGDGAVTLSSGSKIPGGGSCAITVDVSSPVEDVYTNVIPAGALETDKGSSPFEASAELQVGYIFPQPYCEIDFPSAVEPISLVQFDGIDNSSDPTVDASPALENFTAIIGQVRAGRTLTMTVEGNTAGGFTTVIKVYIDWNQNFVFDAGEGYLIGEIIDSTGTDGKQAVGEIQVPLDAELGQTRMRVTKKFSSAADACNTSGYGQAEDYTLEVVPPRPTVSKAFSPDTVQLGDPSTATITLMNITNGDATLTAPLVDTFPAGLTVSNVSSNCGLIVGATSGQSGHATLASGNEITLPAGVVLPAGGSCQITATVQANAAGTYTNVIPAGDLQTDQGNNPEDASATLTVVNSPYITKSFTPATVQRTQDSTAVITLINPAAADAVLTAPLTDDLPGGLVITDASTTCIASAGVATSSLAAGSVTLPAGITIPANGSCQLEITVHSDSLGTYVNEIPAGALETDQGSNLAPASATLNVVTLPSDPVIGATPNSLDAAQSSNTITTQTLTIANTGGSELTWDVKEAEALSGSVDGATNAGHGAATASVGAGSVTGALDLRSLSGGSMQPFPVTATAANCDSSVTNIVIHDDGEAENGYGWNAVANVGRYADPFTPDSYPATITTVCLAFITNAGVSEFNFDLVVYAADGPDGAPGTELGRKSFVAHPDSISGVPATPSYEAFDISGLGINITSGSAYVSVEWDASVEPGSVFIAADESPSTPIANGYAGSNGDPWAPIVATSPEYRALFIRAVMPAPGGVPVCATTELPWLEVTPTSGATAPGESSSVTVTFDSTNLASGTYTGNVCVASNDPVNPIVNVPVSLTVDAADPSATVTPESLSFTLPANETASQTLTIANASGSDPLTFSISARGQNNLRFHLRPTIRESKLATALFAVNPPSLAASNTGAPPTVQQVPWTPLVPAAGESFPFIWDDGSAETAIGWGVQSPPTESMAVFMDRFSPPEGTGAYTITNVSILWPTADMSAGPLTGLQAMLVFYYDFDSDGDPSNAFRIGGDQLVTINAQGEFVNYPVSISVPGDGDIYVGFADWWARAGGYTPRLFPAAIDQTTPMGNSYISADTEDITDLDNLANNDTTAVLGDLNASLAGNWMIRAVGTTGTSCVGPAIPWLTANPVSGSVNAGDSVDVAVTADPAAANLEPGTYEAELCITTNDPAQQLIVIPVTMTVNEAVLPNGIFCSGFELGDDGSCEPIGGGGGGAIVDSGPINVTVPAVVSGITLDWLSGCTSTEIPTTCAHGGDWNPYLLSGALQYYWPAPSEGGHDSECVSSDGTHCDDLAPGDIIGSSSPFAQVDPTAAVVAGGTFYMGFSFTNTDTGETNYGYVKVTSTGPEGFPFTINRYWYDSSGAAITVQ